MIKLPTEKVKSTDQNPRFMILFGKPKCGKTTITSYLENNLILDLEKGSDYVDALKVSVNSMQDLKEVKEAIIEAGKPYKFITLDTATALEDMVMPLAIAKYKETPMGRSFKGKDIRHLPNGAGYLYLREAYKEVIDSFVDLAPYIILLGHQKDKQINKDGKELSENALDLTGKLERIMGAKADALGYIYRKKNQTIINFNGGGDATVEARPSHIRGKEIIIAESDEKGNIKTFWNQIFK